jgi:hypothetical protein
MSTGRRFAVVLLAVLIALAALAALTPVDAVTTQAPPRSSSSPSSSTPPSSSSTADLRGPASLLRFALDYLQEESDDAAVRRYDDLERRGEQRGRTGSQFEVLLDHAQTMLSALYLPLDYLLHISLSHNATAEHPLQQHLNVAMTTMGMKIGEANIRSTVESPPAPTQQVTRPQLKVGDSSSPRTYVQFAWLSLGTPGDILPGYNYTIHLWCVECYGNPAVNFTILPGTASAGVDFNVISTSPVGFPIGRKISYTPVKEGGVQLQMLSPSIPDPFSSPAARYASVQPRAFTLQIRDAKNQDGSAIPIESLDGLRYATSQIGVVSVRSQVLPRISFGAPFVNVTDLDSYAVFTVLCMDCGLVDLNVTVQANMSAVNNWGHSWSNGDGVAYQDLSGVPPTWPFATLSVPIRFTTDVHANPMGTTMPDLSEAGWSSRAASTPYSNYSVSWLDASSFTDPNHVQTAHFALRLNPLRGWQTDRWLSWSFLTQDPFQIESGQAPPPDFSSALIPDQGNSTRQVVIVVGDDTNGGAFPESTLYVRPTIYCSPYGKIANASRTLLSCSPGNVPFDALSPSEYFVFTQGELREVFDGEEEKGVVIDPSITSTLTCSDVFSYFTSAQPNTTTSNFFAPIAQAAPGNDTRQQDLLKQACEGLMGQGGVDFNATLTQYCQLFVRCYARSHYCHSFTDVFQFCICPYDRTGDFCEQFQPWQCDIQMAYPAMQDQHYTDSSDASQIYRCPSPSSFYSRLPSHEISPGANSALPILPQTDLQAQYRFLPHLDGHPPCIEWPSTSNPTVPAVKEAPLDMRFAVDCKFTSDQDTTGASTTSQPPAVEQTYTRIRESPSDNVLLYLASGNFSYDSRWSTAYGPFRYDVLRKMAGSSSPPQILFAQSSSPLNSLSIILHPADFVHLSTTAQDVLTEPASVQVLENPPSVQLVAQAQAKADPSLLTSSTFSIPLNISSLPTCYSRGGRFLFESFLQSQLRTMDLDGPERNEITPDQRQTVYPRGLVGDRAPCRLFLEDSTYTMALPTSDSKLTVTSIFLLCLLGVAIVGSAYKYYMYRKEEAFQELVKANKLKTRARELELEREKQERKAERGRKKTTQEGMALREDREEEKTRPLIEQPEDM